VFVCPEEAVELISRAGFEPGYPDGWRGISPFVVSSVLWSLYSFLKSPEDYQETIRIAIAVGGDVDTTAAMAGAISGAHLGLGAVPSNLAERLTDQGSWGLDELERLAGEGYKLKMQQLDLS
jgi:ADP-ribosylglycohydrolase